jgi:hypothetical protein
VLSFKSLGEDVLKAGTCDVATSSHFYAARW